PGRDRALVLRGDADRVRVSQRLHVRDRVLVAPPATFPAGPDERIPRLRGPHGAVLQRTRGAGRDRDAGRDGADVRVELRAGPLGDPRPVDPLGKPSMKAVILAGGLGTRIAEETHLRPKPMVEIGGMPILWHIMKIYSAHGINDFVICCGYKGYVIKEYFLNY